VSETPPSGDVRAPDVGMFGHRFIPAPEPSRRLAVVLHGRGDSLEGFLWLPEELELPRLNFLLLNAPQPYFGGYSWYDFAPNQEPGILHGRMLLQRLFADLAAQGWPGASTLLFGFSQGCLMAVDFALRHAEPLAGIVGVSGTVYAPERAAAEMHPQAARQRWLMTHGTTDDVLPIGRTRAQVEVLRAAGVPIEWHEFPKAHEIDFRAELPLLRAWIAARFA